MATKKMNHMVNYIEITKKFTNNLKIKFISVGLFGGLISEVILYLEVLLAYA
jgi:hypothetical protein